MVYLIINKSHLGSQLHVRFDTWPAMARSDPTILGRGVDGFLNCAVGLIVDPGGDTGVP